MRSKLFLWVAAAALLTSTLISAKSMSTYFLYVGTYGEGIYGYRYSPDTGKLDPMGVVAKIAAPSFLASDRGYHNLYVVSEASHGNGAVAGFSINRGTGALTAIPGSPFPLSGTEVYSLSTDSAGKFLFVCAANNDQVQVFSINQTSGALAPVGTFATTGFAAQATTDGLGKYLYVTEGNSGSNVDVYAISSTGLLTPIAGSPFPISIATLRSEPTGKFLVGVTGDGAKTASDLTIMCMFSRSINRLGLRVK